MHQGALAGSRSGQIASSVYILYVYGSERRLLANEPGALRRSSRVLFRRAREPYSRSVGEAAASGGEEEEGKLCRMIWNGVEEEADWETREG
ncbi:hypothetical protein MTO96_014838 [Rhipicephalus appendiculatus]